MWDDIMLDSLNPETQLMDLETPPDSDDDNSEMRPKPHYLEPSAGQSTNWLPPSLESWLNGGHPPRRYVFKPLMPALQTAPQRWLDQRFPLRRQRILVFTSLFLLWYLAFFILLDTSIGPVKVDGVSQLVRQLDCTDSFWLPDNGCGIDGAECRPFSGNSMGFHCPANCGNAKSRKIHHVGAQDIVNHPLVIGGSIYRGDSYICSSAVHAGIVSDTHGGCGIVDRVGQTNSYPSSEINGLLSIAVRTYFPLSFKFQFESGFECQANNMRWLLPFLSFWLTVLVFLVMTSSAIPFFLTLAVGFIHVTLVSDAPSTVSRPSPIHAHAVSESSHLLSSFVSKFLPAAFCAVVVYKRSVRRTFHNLTAYIEQTTFWLGGFWIGVLSNHTLEWFPISQLAARDIELQRLAIIGIFMAFVFVYQIYYLRLEGRLAKALPLYAIFLLALFVYTTAPGLGVPIHYLVLGLTLLPGSTVQTRASLFHQGLLLGLFVHGVAHHGFAPALQPTAEDPVFILPIPIPSILEPVISIGNSASNITFAWKTPVPLLLDGISMMVNDVERGRRYFGDENIPYAKAFSIEENDVWNDNFVWRRPPQAVVDYVRFSYLRDGRALGYSDAGVWEVNGTWKGVGSG